MMTLKTLEKKLQKADAKQAKLYLFCNFISLLLITAYSAMMFSPTVLLVLPQGGDSRKQMVAIFVLALFGCVVFTIYASGLFFRKKAKQLGTLMALGASGRRLLPGLFREVLTLSAVSSFLGIVAGFPFVWILWNCFNLISDSSQMALTFDFKCLYLSAVFFVIVVACSCLNAYRYLKKTNIMEVMHEEHRNEPVRELGRWCGPVGIGLVLAGAVLGYMGPVVCYYGFQFYAPAWINILYAPVFVGLYMIMLHTVVYGWRLRKKDPYQNLIARSMMKFQGKQTVNNLLVSTVLIAGSVFGMFYLPMTGVERAMEIKSRPYDYYYHYRADQNVPGEEEISTLAAKHGLVVKDFKKAPYLSLGMDGITEVEEGRSFHYERIPFKCEGRFLSEKSYEALTGEKIALEKGSYMAVCKSDGTGLQFLEETAQVLTNMETFQSIPVKFAGYAHYDLLTDSSGYYVLNSEDYESVGQDLGGEWMGEAVFFNIDGEDSYEFAQDFFYTLISSFGPECEIPSYYDRVSKYYANSQGEVYWGDTPDMTEVSFSDPDSSNFRIYWKYMPKSRLLDQTDYNSTFSVFLMMFLFIAIICSLAAVIIEYTRCMTIVLNNRYVFEDLKRLGASPGFLLKEIRSQAGPVFKIPAIVGMGAMYFLYILLMYGNDGKITASEAGGLAVCLFILMGIGLIYYAVYRLAVKNMCHQIQG
ncbi:MAG: ABC transporter permease [Lachnospiraceae bacterium]|jgi:putative ABC transport system permease protein|nr:ABC transporter permease [Lachnospiraceae bacterium]